MSKYIVINKDIPYLQDSRWGPTIKVGSEFTVIGEVGSFYHIKSPAIGDNRVKVSILKESLDFATELE